MARRLYFQMIQWKKKLDESLGWSSVFGQFALVGALGTAVNVAAVTLGQHFGLPVQISILFGIAVSVFHNFVLNRYLTFYSESRANFLKQFFLFIGSSSVGLVANTLVALFLVRSVPLFYQWPQLASVCGVLAGLVFNYLGSRYIVFKNQ